MQIVITGNYTKDLKAAIAANLFLKNAKPKKADLIAAIEAYNQAASQSKESEAPQAEASQSVRTFQALLAQEQESAEMFADASIDQIYDKYYNKSLKKTSAKCKTTNPGDAGTIQWAEAIYDAAGGKVKAAKEATKKSDSYLRRLMKAVEIYRTNVKIKKIIDDNKISFWKLHAAVGSAAKAIPDLEKLAN